MYLVAIYSSVSLFSSAYLSAVSLSRVNIYSFFKWLHQRIFFFPVECMTCWCVHCCWYMKCVLYELHVVQSLDWVGWCLWPAKIYHLAFIGNWTYRRLSCTRIRHVRPSYSFIREHEFNFFLFFHSNHLHPSMHLSILSFSSFTFLSPSLTPHLPFLPPLSRPPVLPRVGCESNHPSHCLRDRVLSDTYSRWIVEGRKGVRVEREWSVGEETMRVRDREWEAAGGVDCDTTEEAQVDRKGKIECKRGKDWLMPGCVVEKSQWYCWRSQAAAPFTILLSF